MDFKLINCDSLQYLKQMTDNSVDSVITDPPYGLTHLDREFNNLEDTAESGGVFAGKKGGGMLFTASQNRDISEFLLPFFKESFRVLKPGAFCVSFSQGRLLLGVLSALEGAGFEIREQFYWRKPTALPNQQVPAKKNSKTKVVTDRVILGPAKVIEPFIVAQKPREGSYAENFNKWGTGLVDKHDAISTVFECRSASSKEKKDTGITHPTVKPLDLMRRIVRSFTKQGDLVVDPFNGSGTTGIAAIMEERRYIGVELSTEFYTESLMRFEKLTRSIYTT